MSNLIKTTPTPQKCALPGVVIKKADIQSVLQDSLVVNLLVSNDKDLSEGHNGLAALAFILGAVSESKHCSVRTLHTGVLQKDNLRRKHAHLNTEKLALARGRELEQEWNAHFTDCHEKLPPHLQFKVQPQFISFEDVERTRVRASALPKVTERLLDCDNPDLFKALVDSVFEFYQRDKTFSVAVDDDHIKTAICSLIHQYLRKAIPVELADALTHIPLPLQQLLLESIEFLTMECADMNSWQGPIVYNGTLSPVLLVQAAFINAEREKCDSVLIPIQVINLTPKKMGVNEMMAGQLLHLFHQSRAQMSPVIFANIDATLKSCVLQLPDRLKDLRDIAPQAAELLQKAKEDAEQLQQVEKMGAELAHLRDMMSMLMLSTEPRSRAGLSDASQVVVALQMVVIQEAGGRATKPLTQVDSRVDGHIQLAPKLSFCELQSELMRRFLAREWRQRCQGIQPRGNPAATTYHPSMMSADARVMPPLSSLK